MTIARARKIIENLLFSSTALYEKNRDTQTSDKNFYDAGYIIALMQIRDLLAENEIEGE